ncbi:unnamed protein product [Lymnaea stagnalis]|uniref:L-Fucosyltransferase n=1 Tax=Lymnaea stagnalis TaxID=6523 RepID=A0AAV2IHX3_LYMST
MGAKCKGCGSCLLFIVTTIVVYKLSLPVFLENFDPEGDIPSDTRILPKSDRTYSGQHIICHKFEGGLGSTLFQYASLLGIAQRQSRLLVARGNTTLAHLLRAPKFKINKSQCRSVARLVESACCRMDESLVNLEINKNYEIEGSLHSWKYFKDNFDSIRKEVQFHDGIVHQAKRIVEKALLIHNSTTTDTAVVGVHVRRGDKLHWSSVDQGYRVAPREYFLKAMKYFRDLLGGSVAFLVVSDDHAWCKSNLDGLPGVMLIRRHDPSVELTVLGLLDHSIISTGSLSWWAAFMAKGKVVYYADFVEKDSKARSRYDANFEDYMLPGWIPMS